MILLAGKNFSIPSYATQILRAFCANSFPGLGAEIAKPAFADQFNGKHLYKGGEFKSISVIKNGNAPTDGSDYVDGISGGTITSKGVQSMLKSCLSCYQAFFNGIQQNNK